MLNITNLNLANNWASYKYIWRLDDICKVVGGVAFLLAFPDYPRKLDVVMKEFTNRMIQKADRVLPMTNCYLFTISAKDLTRMIYDELVTIKEFREWNLIDLEYEHGIDPDDDCNNEWFMKSDGKFVDLEAFGQNVYCALRSKLIEEHFFEFKDGTI